MTGIFTIFFSCFLRFRPFLRAGSDALPAGSEALPAGTEALPADSETLPIPSSFFQAKALQVPSVALPAPPEAHFEALYPL